MKKTTVYAEDVNYWKTGQSSPDAWMERAKKEVAVAGGKVLGEAYGNDATTGRSAYMLNFVFFDEQFKAVWPVLPCRADTAANQKAAKIQAATMLYHDIKARCVSAKVLGARAAFFTYLQLPDGRTAATVGIDELSEKLPKMFLLPG